MSNVNDLLDEGLALQAKIDQAEHALDADRPERDQVIVTLRKTGMSAIDIAAHFGLARQRVYKILDRAGLRP